MSEPSTRRGWLHAPAIENLRRPPVGSRIATREFLTKPSALFHMVIAPLKSTPRDDAAITARYKRR